MMARPDFSLEAALGGRVAGVDEAGRGPLAGPVLAAALVFLAPPPDALAALLQDSKKLKEAARDAAFAALREAQAVRCVVGGDGLCFSIAGASIIAKVLRDRAMRRLDPRWPAYGFARHAGYPTAAHREALARLGPCPHHRRGFGPVDQAVLKLT